MNQLTIWFAEPVLGVDGLNGESFLSNRHVLMAQSVVQDVSETRFVNDEGDVIGAWPTASVTHWVWSERESDPPRLEEDEKEKRWGTRAWREWAQATYPNAWTRWTRQQDRELEDAFRRGATLTELTQSVGRSPGGVLIRLKKLELISEDIDMEELEIELRRQSLRNDSELVEAINEQLNSPASDEVRRSAWRQVLDSRLTRHRSELISQPGAPEIDLREECENCHRKVAPGELHDCPF
jgi:hypothetical protein